MKKILNNSIATFQLLFLVLAPLYPSVLPIFWYIKTDNPYTLLSLIITVCIGCGMGDKIWDNDFLNKSVNFL